jgi:dTDP-4-dehydrorhamnose reductase
LTSPKRILVTGGSGLLALELRKLATFAIDDFWLFKSKEQLNILNVSQIDEVIKETRPHIIFHAAALTKPMVLHEDSPAISVSNNIIGTSNIAIACINHNIKMVYISTDWVYSGKGGMGMYSEEEGCNPTTNYGRSKLGGECAAQMVPSHLVLRTSMTPKPFPHKVAFTDSIKSSMYIKEAAEVMKNAIDRNLEGVYNLGGPAMSIYDFAEQENPDIKGTLRSSIKNISIPENTSMNCAKLERAIQWKK